MDSYKFIYKDKAYELSKDNCDYIFLSDEENEITGIELSDILELLNGCMKVSFDSAYYSQPCEKCLYGKEEKLKYFNFLEYHFYIFTKDNKYVISSISKEYEDTSFSQLLKLGKIDNSFIVMIMVCENCGAYAIEIEQCDI
ncbi:DUF3785 domain-containing protein [Clostridium sp. MSJ-11]|uniref:DUF3785 domain-containing protein n=1 Tax=Clostridium mobile TaxID=2841512 RepID=A0ABS6EDC5_9CLOT|nr:DUF3785 family protein [Clostridium mobile]MBU5483196.1 DUF3785 domain-containing protein [Clostridium mobile]